MTQKPEPQYEACMTSVNSKSTVKNRIIERKLRLHLEEQVKSLGTDGRLGIEQHVEI